MEAHDRLANLGLFGGAVLAWLLVAVVVTTRDPQLDPPAGLIGAALIGVAFMLTSIPLFWLAGFARNRRIAYRGDWTRAIRRGAWIGLLVVVVVVLRLQGLFEPQVGLFLVALVVVAEVALSSER